MRNLFLFLLFVLLTVAFLFFNDDPGKVDNELSVPIDGGVIALVIGGAVLGIKKIFKK